MKNIYQEIFEYMNKGLAVFKVFNDGENFEFIEYNRAAEAIDGKTREEVLGREFTEVFPVAREIGFVELLQEIYQTGKRMYTLRKIPLSKGHLSDFLSHYQRQHSSYLYP